MGQMWNYLPGYTYGNLGNPNTGYPPYPGSPYQGYAPTNGNGYYGRPPQGSFYGNPMPNGTYPPGAFPQMVDPRLPMGYFPQTAIPTNTGNGKDVNDRNAKQNGQPGGPKASSDSPGKELLEEAKAAQNEMQSDSKSDSGGGDGAGRSEGMKAVGILMQVAGVVTSMDMIAMALQLTGFILNATGMALETAGTAMDASGMAMIASGQALCSNPFTAAAGAAMIAAGTALKVTGNAMKVAGKAMKIIGKALEKTAKALQKALKVLMRGAKNGARNAMNKMRKMKKAGADKMMRMRKAKAAKLKNAGKTKKAGKMEKKADYWKRSSEKTQTKIQKTQGKITESQAKNRVATQNLKNETKAEIAKGGQAMKSIPSKAKADVKRQWKETGLFKRSNYGPKTSAKGAYKQSKQKFQENWKNVASRPNGASRVSETKNGIKTEWGKLKTDFKGQFRTPKTEKPKAPEAGKAGKSMDDLAGAPKTRPSQAAPRPTKESLKLDPKTEAKLHQMKNGNGKSKPTKSGHSADDLASTPKGRHSQAPSRPTKESLKLDPKTQARLNEMKAAENATRFDKMKAFRWTMGATTIGVGAGLVSEANASSDESWDNPLMFRDRFDSWEDWHRYYDPIMKRASGDPDSYRSGYYDEHLLGPYPGQYGPIYPNQNQAPPYYYYHDSAGSPLGRDWETQA